MPGLVPGIHGVPSERRGLLKWAFYSILLGAIHRYLSDCAAVGLHFILTRINFDWLRTPDLIQPTSVLPGMS